MELGKIQTLTVSERNHQGVYLEDKNKEKCFLPKIFSDESWNIGDKVEVFVYQDNNQLQATIETPFCQVGEFAVMTCTHTLPSGAFMDWGIIKDLFIPYKQQKTKIIEGKKYLVYVYIDEETGLLTGTTKFKRNPQYQELPFKKGDKVSLIIANESELGWNVIINQKYIGLVYFSDIYKKLYPFSKENLYIEPAIQVSYGEIDNVNSTASNGLNTKIKTIRTWTTGGDVKLGFKTNALNTYVKAGVSKEFLGDTDFLFNTSGDERRQVDKGIVTFGAGLEYHIGDHSISLEVVRKESNLLKDFYQASIGYQYKF